MNKEEKEGEEVGQEHWLHFIKLLDKSGIIFSKS